VEFDKGGEAFLHDVGFGVADAELETQKRDGSEVGVGGQSLGRGGAGFLFLIGEQVREQHKNVLVAQANQGERALTTQFGGGVFWFGLAPTPFLLFVLDAAKEDV